MKKENFLNNTKIYSANTSAIKVYFIISGEVEVNNLILIRYMHKMKMVNYKEWQLHVIMIVLVKKHLHKKNINIQQKHNILKKHKLLYLK